jgi:hypothetical protein
MSEERNTTAVVETSTATAMVEPEERLTLRDVTKTKGEHRAFVDLLGMFSHCRPHDTKATVDFAKKWLKPLGAKMDKRGNWRLRIGDDSKVLWSSHIDTVDWREGAKKLTLNSSTGVLRLSDKDSNSSCLGADCTTGVWIMREMALAKVPGLYIWHEAEEAGGIGSSWIKNNDSGILKGMNAAIAFDRKGFDNIITEQSGGQCCSNEFAAALALQLPDTNYKADPTGTFTDTANYTHIIPECTNLSVGYFNQHFKGETQNVIFAMLLRAAMLRFDETKLVIKRKPGEGKRTYNYASWSGMDDWDGGSYGGYKSAEYYVRNYVIIGDTVKILASAFGQGALDTDIGRQGKVMRVGYAGSARTLNIKFADDGDWIENLKDYHVKRVVPETKVPERKVTYYNKGDRVRIAEAGRADLTRRAMGTMIIDNLIGSEGVIADVVLRNNTADIQLDSGRMLWGFDGKGFELVKAVEEKKEPAKNAKGKVKDYSKTRCGGLCAGKCQGMCADPVKLDMLKRLAAQVDKAQKEPKVSTQRSPSGRAVKVYDYEDDGCGTRSCKTLHDFVVTYPDHLVDMIEQWGLTLKDLYDSYPDCL